MKDKSLLIASAVLMLFANTAEFWLNRLADWPLELMIFFGLLALYGLVALLLLIQVIHLFYRRQLSPKTGLLPALTALMLALCWLPYTSWLRSREPGSGVVLLAARSSDANCREELVFFKNGSFQQHASCFGRQFANGTYQRTGDTLRLQYSHSSTDSAARYASTVIRRAKDEKEYSHLYLYRYGNETRPRWLNIELNTLQP